MSFDIEISYADDNTATNAATAPAPAPAPALTAGQKAAATRAARKAGLLPPAPTKAEQDRERICPTGKARAATDAEIAAKLGFPVSPTVYALGTVVNSIGVENFAASRSDWEQLPSLPEMAREFTAQIAAEQRADIPVTADAITMVPSGDLLAGGKAFAMGERAFNGLAVHVTPGGASYLRQCPPELRAANVNHWLTKATQRDAKASKAAGVDVMRPREMSLRTRVRNAKPEVYAVTGPRYVAYDVDAVARAAAAGIGGDARGKLTYDGYRMTLDAIFHSNIAPENAVAGEYFKGCVRVRAADDGTGSVNVSLGLWRNLCRNLIIVDFDEVLVGRRLHLGSATIEADIAALMATANERIGLVVGKWSEASTEDVLERYNLTDIDDVFRGLVLNGCVKATGVSSDEMIERLHAAWSKERGYNKTAVLNAITRAAHESAWNSWADQEQLESTAGELLYQPVWNLDLSERTAEELLA